MQSRASKEEKDAHTERSRSRSRSLLLLESLSHCVAVRVASALRSLDSRSYVFATLSLRSLRVDHAHLRAARWSTHSAAPLCTQRTEGPLVATRRGCGSGLRAGALVAERKGITAH